MKKIIIFCLTTIMFLCSCSNNIENNKDKLSIVTTIFPAYDFARQIAGDNAEVTLLLPPGSESHSFEPSPKDIVAIQKADLFICNGGESESWVKDILNSIGADKNKCIEMTSLVPLYQEETTQEHHTHEHDEHVWCSPMNAITIAENIAEKLCIIDTDNTDVYIENKNRLVREFNELDETFKAIVSSAQNKTVIFADRFPVRYFTEEYGLEYLAAFPGCTSEAEPSASVIASLINKVKTEKIKGVFYIEFSNEKVADVICEETGCEKYLFHSCHTVSENDLKNGETYVSIMRKNAENLRKVLNNESD